MIPMAWISGVEWKWEVERKEKSYSSDVLLFIYNKKL